MLCSSPTASVSLLWLSTAFTRDFRRPTSDPLPSWWMVSETFSKHCTLEAFALSCYEDPLLMQLCFSAIRPQALSVIAGGALHGDARMPEVLVAYDRLWMLIPGQRNHLSSPSPRPRCRNRPLVRYSRVCRSWRRRVAEEAPCAVLQVETSVIVPVQLASECLEVSAATFRPKIRRLLPLFLIPLEPQELKVHSTGRGLELIKEDVLEGAIQVDMPHDVLSSLEVDRSVPPAEMKGGEEEGQRALDRFIRGGLSAYRNGKAGGPAKQSNSFLSPYLHFGHISALQVSPLLQSPPLDPSPPCRGFRQCYHLLLFRAMLPSRSASRFLFLVGSTCRKRRQGRFGWRTSHGRRRWRPVAQQPQGIQLIRFIPGGAHRAARAGEELCVVLA